AGKQVRFGPVVFWIGVGTVTLLGMWSAATATYFGFRDDVLTRLIARQAEMQYAYEDRIAELRARVDRTTSRQLLDQEQFDQKLDQVMRRQTALESRATALGAVPDAAVTGSIRPQGRGAAADTPSGKPVIGEVEFTSGFGVRSDPFLGRPAMHTGLDFRAATGDPVRVTANGKVVSSGWQGGYGRMVEVDHGNGLSTRYGHLSAINVKVGDTIKIGQVIGAVGSTGRSTGPHLHYETRIDGDAVDPQKFLRAGVRLSAG